MSAFVKHTEGVMRGIRAVALTLPVLAACGSAPKPSPQLEAARQAYTQAASGPAARFAPATLNNAHDTLLRAEQANRNGDDARREFADLARSRAELADAQARAAIATHQRDASAITLAQAQAQRDALLAAAANSRRPQQGVTSTQPPPNPLLGLADQTRQSANGTEVVIASGLQFPKNDSQLSPQAKRRLDQVATALQQTQPAPTVTIEGFTDASGSSARNQELSQERAAAVAGYLTQKGVPQDRVTVRGLGPSEPVGDNATPAGRLGNRRVEIHVDLPAANQ